MPGKALQKPQEDEFSKEELAAVESTHALGQMPLSVEVLSPQGDPVLYLSQCS